MYFVLPNFPNENNINSTKYLIIHGLFLLTNRFLKKTSQQNVWNQRNTWLEDVMLKNYLTI